MGEVAWTGQRESSEMTFERFSDVIKLSGIVVGGAWTLWTYYKLQTEKRKELEIANSIARLRKSELEIETAKRQLLREQPQLGIALGVTGVVSNKSYIICVDVTLKNEGDLNLEIEFDDAALSVGRITSDVHHRQSVKDLRRSSHWLLPSEGKTAEAVTVPRIFRIGQVRKLVFAVEVGGPGIYLVQFQAMYEEIPFDHDKSRRKSTKPIIAIEQAIHVVTEHEESTRTAI
jgi:hypothetical protein